MEYVEGRPLSRELLARGRFGPEEALEIAWQAAAALAAAEKRKIVHRDIKPDNMIMTPRGDVKITDLGLAKRLADVTSASQSNWGCGTPYYMAPEQARNSSRVDIRADIYALGATLYHLVTGKLPFEGPSSVEVLMRAASDRLIPPSVLCPDVPPALSDLVERMMSRDPDGRPPTALALIEEVEQVRKDLRSKRPSKRFSRRGPGQTVASALLGAAGPSGLIQTGAWALAALAVVGLVVHLSGRRPGVEPAPPLPVPADGGGDGGGNGTGTPANGTATGNGGETPPATPPAESEHQKEMRALLAGLQEVLASERPADYAAALGLVARSLPEAGEFRPALEQARSELVARVEFLAGRELKRRVWLGEQALAWGRPGQALEQMDAVSRLWPSSTAAAAAGEARRRLGSRAEELVRELSARFDRLLAAECFDRAEGLLARVESGFLVECARWKEAAGARLPALRREAAGRRESIRTESARQEDALRSAEGRMAAWDFQKAVVELEEAAGKLPAGGPLRLRLELAAARARSLLRFRGEVLRRINARAGSIEDRAFMKPERLRGMVVAKAHPKLLEMTPKDDPGVVVTPVYMKDLEPGEIQRLVGLVISRRSGSDQLGVGLLHMGARNLREAEAYLEAAERLGDVGKDMALHRRELGMLTSAGDERAAEKLEAEARRLAAGGDPASALARLARVLADYRRTRYVSSRAGVLRALLRETERDCLLAGPFSGGTLEVLPECLEISYDLSLKEHAADWEASASGDSQRITWLSVFTGEFSAEFRLAGLAGRAVLTVRPVAGSGSSAARTDPLCLGSRGPTWEGRPLEAVPAAAGAAPGDDPAAEEEPPADAEDDGAATGTVLRLAMRGAELAWRTPTASGRARLPAELLDGLAAGRLTGWKLSLELPPGARAETARVGCRRSADVAAAARALRARIARVRLERAERVAAADPLLGAEDLARVAQSYREVFEVSARAELARAAALIAAGRLRQAEDVLHRFRVGYASQTDLLPRVKELLDTIGRTSTGPDTEPD
jgi:hypothetical protein